VRHFSEEARNGVDFEVKLDFLLLPRGLDFDSMERQPLQLDFLL
jgi:hypothetical protein